MALKFLDFDFSESVDGVGTLEAMASVDERHWTALQDELQQVLRWCSHEFAGVRGPLDEDGDWDFDLQGTRERVTPLQWDFDTDQGSLSCEDGHASHERLSVTLTLSGSPAFCRDFAERFGLSLP